MPIYRITNLVTKERAGVDAPYAKIACDLLGWLIGNCQVELVREGPFSDPNSREAGATVAPRQGPVAK